MKVIYTISTKTMITDSSATERAQGVGISGVKGYNGSLKVLLRCQIREEASLTTKY